MMTFHVKERATGKKIRRSRDLYETLKELGLADQESFWLIGCNAGMREIFRKCLFIGGTNNTVVDSTIIFNQLLLHAVTSWAIVHNHPSGVTHPSEQDLTVTEKLRQASKVLNIPMFDHIIITDEGYYSFADNHWTGSGKPTRLVNTLADHEAKLSRDDTAKLCPEALEWWGYLKVMVLQINNAALTRDDRLLRETFIQGINALGLEVKREKTAQARVLTLLDFEQKLSNNLRWYKSQVKSILNKRRRLKNPVSKRGPLKQSTLKEYRLALNRWPKEQRELKTEIRDLRATIKALTPTSRIFKFKYGPVLTLHPGGRLQTKLPAKGP